MSAPGRRQSRYANTARSGIYLASPIPTYATVRYDRMSDLVQSRYPGETVLEARRLFTSSEDWRAQWPGIVARIARLVFFANEDGSLGAGVMRELYDARWHNVPIEFITDDRTFVSTYTLALNSVDDPRCVAFVHAGDTQ